MNLTNYLEFLENSKKFKEMDKAEKEQMLGEINELIKADSRWVLNSRSDESKRRVKNALSQRLYSDILDDTLFEISQKDFAIVSVFNSQNSAYPKELKNARKNGDIDFAVAFGKGKDYEFKDIFSSVFIIFAKNSSFDLKSFACNLTQKYFCGVYAYATNNGNFKLFNADNEFATKQKPSKIINFYENCEIDLNALRELCPNPLKSLNFSLTSFKVLFYERLCDEILKANRQIIGSVTCYTARSLWSDNYDVSSYFKGFS